MEICIFGASSDKLDPVFFEEARALGLELARSGHTLVYGGGSTGLMDACAQGIRSGGGRAVGIAPRYFDEGDFLCRDFGELIYTETMAERKALMLERSDAFIVLPGGTGTMDEFFEALTLRQLGRLRGRIVLLNTAGYYEPLRALLRYMVDRGFTSMSALELLSFCDSPAAAVACAAQSAPEQARGLSDYGK